VRLIPLAQARGKPSGELAAYLSIFSLQSLAHLWAKNSNSMGTPEYSSHKSVPAIPEKQLNNRRAPKPHPKRRQHLNIVWSGEQ